jgi:hypothetical protein
MNETKGENGSSRSLTVRHDDVNTGLHVMNLLDEKQLANAEIFLKKIIASDKGGIKSVNEGLAVLMRAQDLRLPFSTCIEHIHVINGKTGVDVHIVKALLSRAGIVWETTKDYVPQYKYTDGNSIFDETLLPQYCVKCRTKAEAESKTNDDVIGVYPLKYYKDLKGRVYNEFQLSDKCVKCINQVQAMKVANDGQFPVIRTQAVATDYVTEYHFTRYKKIYGKVVETHAVGHFSYSEASQADLFTKDTFKKYTRIMIGHRAFMYGARDIASDILMGVMSDDELSEVFVNSVPNDEDFVNVEEITPTND